MSDRTFDPIVDGLANRALTILLNVIWNQWGILNSVVHINMFKGQHNVIDPEALVLTSLCLMEHERRLGDALMWYAAHLSVFSSIQRMRTLMQTGLDTPAITWFAREAVTSGNDRRWKVLGEELVVSDDFSVRRDKGPEAVSFPALGSLIFRLRAGFGVGVKADICAYLLCLDGQPRTVAEVSAAVLYTEKTVRSSLRELTLSGLVQETDEYPARYGVRQGFASQFVVMLYADVNAPVPLWSYWAQVFSFLLTVIGWKSEENVRGSAYLASSRAKDLYRSHNDIFRFMQLKLPRPELYPGASYLIEFSAFFSAFDYWIAERLNA